MAEFSKSGNVYPLSIENWLNIIKPGGNEDFLSDNDYWRVIQALKEHGFFYKNEIPEDMQAVEAAPGIPVLTPVFFDNPQSYTREHSESNNRGAFLCEITGGNNADRQ